MNKSEEKLKEKIVHFKNITAMLEKQVEIAEYHTIPQLEEKIQTLEEAYNKAIMDLRAGRERALLDREMTEAYRRILSKEPQKPKLIADDIINALEKIEIYKIEKKRYRFRRR